MHNHIHGWLGNCPRHSPAWRYVTVNFGKAFLVVCFFQNKLGVHVVSKPCVHSGGKRWLPRLFGECGGGRWDRARVQAVGYAVARGHVAEAGPNDGCFNINRQVGLALQVLEHWRHRRRHFAHQQRATYGPGKLLLQRNQLSRTGGQLYSSACQKYV